MDKELLQNIEKLKHRVETEGDLADNLLFMILIQLLRMKEPDNGTDKVEASTSKKTG